LSPFASRYASTAGTRSAALALIATVGGRLRRAATRCEPSPKPWRRFRVKRGEKAPFCSRFLFTAFLHAHLVLHKVKSKIRDCSQGKRLSGKPEDVAARRALRAFDSAVGIAPRVKVRVFPGKGRCRPDVFDVRFRVPLPAARAPFTPPLHSAPPHRDVASLNTRLRCPPPATNCAGFTAPSRTGPRRS
jgi:hypothetical protein